MPIKTEETKWARPLMLRCSQIPSSTVPTQLHVLIGGDVFHNSIRKFTGDLSSLRIQLFAQLIECVFPHIAFIRLPHWAFLILAPTPQVSQISCLNRYPSDRKHFWGVLSSTHERPSGFYLDSSDSHFHRQLAVPRVLEVLTFLDSLPETPTVGLIFAFTGP